MSHHHVARAVERSCDPEEESGTDVSAGMGSSTVSTRFKISCFVDDTACAFSQESALCGKTSPMTLKGHRDDSEGGLSYLSNQLAIEDVFPDNLDVLAKPWEKNDQHVYFDFPADVGTEETAYHCSKVVQATTMHRGRYQIVVLARSGGRSHIISRKMPSTHGFEPHSNITNLVVEFGSLDSSQCTLGVSAGMSDINRQENQRLLSIKADGKADRGGVKNVNKHLWRRRWGSRPYGKLSPMSLNGQPDDVEGDVSHQTNLLAIEDVLPDKAWNKNEQLVHRNFLADVGTTETAYHCSKVVHASTMQGGRYQMVVLSRSGGRSHIISSLKHNNTFPLFFSMAASAKCILDHEDPWPQHDTATARRGARLMQLRTWTDRRLCLNASLIGCCGRVVPCSPEAEDSKAVTIVMLLSN
ncbi:hypothetical protein HPB50_028974 [Hyalomma asiaticum]|nr:hypothetical protein HPB50_028974 [Hyalomma asiaticum]